MKKLIIIACSAAMLSICSLAQAQESDTTSASEHYQRGVEKTADDIEEGSEEASNEVRQEAKEVEATVEQGADATEQELEQAANEMEATWEQSAIDAKVGPNGEKLFTENGKYFYYNEDGKKVKVKKADLKDKSDMKETE